MQAQFALWNSSKTSAPTVDKGAEDVTAKRTLLNAEPGVTYTIKEINTDDDEMNSFLFRLDCYEGEPITLISKKRKRAASS